MKRAVFLVMLAATPAAAETYFAHVNADKIVDWVVVAGPEIVADSPDPSQWVQTYVNPTGSQPKNYAGKGYTWDPGRNCFIPPMAVPDSTLDEATCLWIPPPEPPARR